jgi:hypothetical protein
MECIRKCVERGYRFGSQVCSIEIEFVDNKTIDKLSILDKKQQKIIL